MQHMSLRRWIHRLSGGRFLPPRPVVAVLRLEGLIMARGGGFGRRSLSLPGLADQIERAFGLDGLVAVALAINSPGGSPAQSALIQGRIRQFAAEKNVPVLAFAEDVAASGGYWLALAADEIFATEGSIVGSIGVISAGFGFDQAIERLGIRRRLYTAGERKSMLDSFLPERPEDVERLKRLQAEIHDGFKDWVRQRRTGRLKGDEATLFTGEFWTGRRGLELGLADGLGELRTTLQARYGAKVHLPVIAQRRRLLSRFGLGTAIDGMGIGPSTLAALEERLHWQRFGL